jgi:hypothetical protein
LTAAPLRQSSCPVLFVRLAGASLVAVLAGCGPGRPATLRQQASVPNLPQFSVFAEGPCPKLKVFDAGPRSFLVYGTYGLDEVAFGDLRPRAR